MYMESYPDKIIYQSKINIQEIKDMVEKSKRNKNKRKPLKMKKVNNICLACVNLGNDVNDSICTKPESVTQKSVVGKTEIVFECSEFLHEIPLENGEYQISNQNKILCDIEIKDGMIVNIFSNLGK